MQLRVAAAFSKSPVRTLAAAPHAQLSDPSLSKERYVWTCESACAFQGNHWATQVNTPENDHVCIFILFFVNLQLAARECFPLLRLPSHGREAAAAARKSSGKPLMDNYATTPRPQHLAPLSFLLHKNNNKQVADPAVRFCHSFPTVGAADAEKFPFFRMHI